MVRIRGVAERAQRFESVHGFLQGRGVAWLLQEQYCLGLDYIVRSLNMRQTCPVNLLLAKAAGSVLRESELVRRCDVALESRCKKYHARSPQDLLEKRRTRSAPGVSLVSPPPSSADVRAVIERAMCLEASAQPERVETLHVKERLPLSEVQKLVDDAASRIHGPILTDTAESGRVVVVLEPKDSVYGRGLYANKRIKKGTVILRDDLFLAQRMNEHVCSHCLAPLQKKSGSLGAACDHCKTETYCSASCRDAAWKQYHQCMCSSVNPALNEWSEHMHRQLREAGGETGADSKAALSCLAAAKIFGMCTVRQEHPLSAMGLSHLRGYAEFEARSGLSNIGAMSVTLAAAFRQPNLYVEDVVSLLAILQVNEVMESGGIALYPVISLMNHSCVPNCVVATANLSHQQVVAVSDIRAGEQLLIDYNPRLTGSLSYEERRSLFAQRNFECFCSKCILKQ